MTQYIDAWFEDCYTRGYSTPGWYFWDETQIYCYGPYPTVEEADRACGEYARIVLHSRNEHRTDAAGGAGTTGNHGSISEGSIHPAEMDVSKVRN